MDRGLREAANTVTTVFNHTDNSMWAVKLTTYLFGRFEIRFVLKVPGQNMFIKE
jgi:hypothetical protein